MEDISDLKKGRTGMKVFEGAQVADTLSEKEALRMDRPLDLALLTIIPRGKAFSIQLPAVDWENDLQALYAFTYDGKAQPKEAKLPASMQVVPIPRIIGSHCMDAADGAVTQDCQLQFEQGRTIDIQSDITVCLSGEEMARLNDHLAHWDRN
jgi:hypothetical protein